jgi:3'-phosphoadenosine 5'-phosphosulfate sulfotransferase (PAPS reductase)/FAD synthetase
MRKAIEIIDEVAKESDSVILFHSLSGKDSIALLDLLYPRFRRVVCVYMYVVKNLRHINRYLAYAQLRYPNVEFVQVPHYGLFSDIKTGYLGHFQNPKQKKYSLSDLTEMVRSKTGIEWVCYGFKKSDSLNRRLMLSTYRMEAINDKTKKFYPLSCYLNKDITQYITERGLKRPEAYGKGQSSGCDIGDIEYLLFLKSNFPDDLRRVIKEYPLAEGLIFNHEAAKRKQDADN